MTSQARFVTVVTPTKNRIASLLRAIKSVGRQTGVLVEHVIVGDDCPQLRAQETEIVTKYPFVRLIHVTKQTHPDIPSGWIAEKIAFLRNIGIKAAQGTYVAHLDDDNEYESDHLSSLVGVLESNKTAVVAHSWRKLFTADGEPYQIQEEDIWYPFPQGRRDSYQRLAAAGILEKGSSVVRDASTIDKDGNRITRIDTSEFVVIRAFHLEHLFPTSFSFLQRLFEATDDVVFTASLMADGVVPICSSKATLRYYLGGYSNALPMSKPFE